MAMKCVSRRAANVNRVAAKWVGITLMVLREAILLM